MCVVQQRLNQLVGVMLERDLTAVEARELRESYQVIVQQQRAQARVLNLLPLAVSTRDWEWVVQIYRDYRRVFG